MYSLVLSYRGFRDYFLMRRAIFYCNIAIEKDFLLRHFSIATSQKKIAAAAALRQKHAEVVDITPQQKRFYTTRIRD